MELFVGRKRELEKLNKVYGQGMAVLIYGRRRVGKSTLIKKFCEGKNYLYLTCIGDSILSNLEYIHRMVTEYRGVDSGDYHSILDMVRDLARICTDGNNIIVIDEYQYLKKADRSIDSFIQQLIDDTLQHSQSTLILCGSAVSMMKGTGEDGNNPLYGRFGCRMHLGPLSFEDCRAFHPDMPDHDLMMLYLTFGGIPRYHKGSDCRTFKEFFIRNCLEDPWVADEALFLLNTDFPNSSECDHVLKVIAQGSVTPKEIQERTGLGTRYVAIVKALMDNGVLDTVRPMLRGAKRSTYYIQDVFLSFYYGVLRERDNLLEHKDREKVYELIHPYLKTHLGVVFERYCMDVLRREYPVIDIGRWWIDDPKRDIHEDIDIVAEVSFGRYRVNIFAECKFISKKVGFHQYNQLDGRVQHFFDHCNPCLMMISESGFEDDLVDFAESAGVMLIGPDELYGHRPFPGMPAPE